jgi:hypothetical protein
VKALIFVFSVLCLNASAAPSVNTYGVGGGLFSDPPRTTTAIKGYDTVAYFLESRPVKGLEKFSHTWKDATWLFASQENLDKFKADPDRWAPQYGGYCAYGVANGYLVKIEPEEFTVVDGKLYLNYDSGVTKKWKKDIAGYVATANGKFPKLLRE